jgi:flagellar biosynthesis/type III secretory pathway protein FliH
MPDVKDAPKASAEAEAPVDEKKYPDPEKGSSTKPGTKALAQQKLAEAAQAEQDKAAKDKASESKSMGMSKARAEAYKAAEADGNK